MFWDVSTFRGSVHDQVGLVETLFLDDPAKLSQGVLDLFEDDMHWARFEHGGYLRNVRVGR